MSAVKASTSVGLRLRFDEHCLEKQGALLGIETETELRGPGPDTGRQLPALVTAGHQIQHSVRRCTGNDELVQNFRVVAHLAAWYTRTPVPE